MIIPINLLDFKKFGAVGDGVADDTVAMQAAIDDYVQRHSGMDDAAAMRVAINDYLQRHSVAAKSSFPNPTTETYSVASLLVPFGHEITVCSIEKITPNQSTAVQ